VAKINIFDVTPAEWSQPFPTHQKKLQTPSLNRYSGHGDPKQRNSNHVGVPTESSEN